MNFPLIINLLIFYLLWIWRLTPCWILGKSSCILLVSDHSGYRKGSLGPLQILEAVLKQSMIIKTCTQKITTCTLLINVPWQKVQFSKIGWWKICSIEFYITYRWSIRWHRGRGCSAVGELPDVIAVWLKAKVKLPVHCIMIYMHIFFTHWFFLNTKTMKTRL